MNGKLYRVSSSIYAIWLHPFFNYPNPSFFRVPNLIIVLMLDYEYNSLYAKILYKNQICCIRKLDAYNFEPI